MAVFAPLLTIWAIIKESSEACPTHIQPVASLDIERYKGTWHEMYRRRNVVGQSGQCGTVKYGDAEGGISVWNMEWFGAKPNQTVRDIRGRAYCPDGVSGKCRLKFNFWAIPEGAYNVIDTDYNNYAIVYTCSKILGISKFEQMWVLSRTPKKIGSPEHNVLKNKVKSIIDTKF